MQKESQEVRMLRRYQAVHDCYLFHFRCNTANNYQHIVRQTDDAVSYFIEMAQSINPISSTLPTK